MVEQTKWCVKALRESGLKRSEFRARVQRNSRGEYGDVDIALLIPTQDALKFVDTLSRSFEVVLYKIDGIVRSVVVSESNKPGVRERHV